MTRQRVHNVANWLWLGTFVFAFVVAPLFLRGPIDPKLLWLFAGVFMLTMLTSHATKPSSEICDKCGQEKP